MITPLLKFAESAVDRRYLSSACASLAVASLMAACSTDPGNPQSINQTETARGTLGSNMIVLADGRTVNLADSEFLIDNEPVTVQDLRPGMQVVVQEHDDGSTFVYYDEDIKGPVDMLNIDGTLSVMGQIVHISATTSFDDVNAQNLLAGDIVEVSGIRDENQVINATYIEREEDRPRAYSVIGAVEVLDIPNQSFRIGQLTIDYSQSTFSDFTESALHDGMIIEAKDHALSYEPGSFYLSATKLEHYDFDDDSATGNGQAGSGSPDDSGEDDGDDHDEVHGAGVSDDNQSSDASDDTVGSGSSDDGSGSQVEFDGIVTSFDSANGTLSVEGIVVRTSSSTEYTDMDDNYIDKASFFSRLVTGVSIVKVRWRDFTDYEAPAQELEIEA